VNLDKDVAEKVMGYTIYHYDKDVEERCYYMLMDENFDPIANDIPWSLHNGERKTEEEAWSDCPKFSSDISAAWNVVEKVLSDEQYKWSFGMEYSSVIDWVVDFTPRVNHPKAREYPAFQVVASTPSEAICKAALLAISSI
jgi:hypothetical protein